MQEPANQGTAAMRSAETSPVPQPDTQATHPPAKFRNGTIDRQLARLSANRSRWASLAVPAKIDYLRRIRDATILTAAQWVEASVRAKGTLATPSLAGEEWMSGPWVLLRCVKQMIHTLESVCSDATEMEADLQSRRTASGQLAVQVFPRRLVDRLLMNGVRAEVWLEPEARLESATDYRHPASQHGGLQLVLGAGNISSIAVLDALYKLYNEHAVVMLKLNPVTDYLSPVLEKIFAPLIEDGYFALASGAADLGAWLCTHPMVDAIHITGSAATHDRIVFGNASGPNRRRHNLKPITSELGGVSPVIVVPGPWTQADLRFQAAHIATQRLHNGGFNCIASQIAILPESWQQTPALIDAIRAAVNQAPSRPAYYPGSSARLRKFRERYNQPPDRADPERLVIPVAADSRGEEALIFLEEAFAAVLGITRLPGTDALAYLDNAIDFCNERLSGSLGVSLLIHPATLRELGNRLDPLLARLRYGCIGINIWQGAGFFLTETPWGAYPGHTIDDVQSGIGKVHNTLMLARTQKSVVYGPFHPFPRALLHDGGLLPFPPWFVSHRSAHRVGRLLFDFEAGPSLLKIPKIAWHASQWR